MANRGDPYNSAMAWWGPITASADRHEPTAAMWERIHAYTAQHNLVEPPNLFRMVNDVRAGASELTYSSERLGHAPASDVITGGMIAGAPYSTRASGAGLPRVFDVRLTYTATRTGVEETGHVTLQYTGGLPPTVGALRDEALDILGSLVEGYSASLSSLDSIQIAEL